MAQNSIKKDSHKINGRLFTRLSKWLFPADDELDAKQKASMIIEFMPIVFLYRLFVVPVLVAIDIFRFHKR